MLVSGSVVRPWAHSCKSKVRKVVLWKVHKVQSQKYPASACPQSVRCASLCKPKQFMVKNALLYMPTMSRIRGTQVYMSTKSRVRGTKKSLCKNETNPKCADQLRKLRNYTNSKVLHACMVTCEAHMHTAHMHLHLKIWKMIFTNSCAALLTSLRRDRHTDTLLTFQIEKTPCLPNLSFVLSDPWKNLARLNN